MATQDDSKLGKHKCETFAY